MIKGNWIKKGAAVIDVGTNSVEDKSKKSGYALVGDVDFNEAKKKPFHHASSGRCRSNDDCHVVAELLRWW